MRYKDLPAYQRKKMERHPRLKCPRRRIDFIRKVMAGWTIDRLAREVGCTRTHLSLVLNGKRNLSAEMEQKCFETLEFDKGVCRVLNALISYPSTHHITRNAGR